MKNSPPFYDKLKIWIIILDMAIKVNKVLKGLYDLYLDLFG